MRWRIGALLCVVSAALALAACGSSSKKTTSTAASTGGSTTTSSGAGTASGASTAKGTPFVLGSICGCSGPQAAVLGGGQKVIQAWADDVNASGGINGHPVKVIVKDDGESPTTTLQAAKELIEQDHVMALVGPTTTADSGYATYVAQKGVPVLGGASVEPAYLSNPDFFPAGGNLIGLIFGTIKVAKDAGKGNFGALYCAESPVCAQLIPIAQGMAKLIGIKVTPLKISSTSPNYTAPCLALKGDGVDALYVADNGAVIARVVANCAQQGYKPVNIGQSSTLTADLLKNPSFEGTLVAGSSANPYDTSLPTVKRMNDALNKYFPGFTTGSQFAYDAIYPWSGGILFEDAAKAGNLSPSSTPADVKKALYSLKNETAQGISGPITYTPGKPAFPLCWFNQQIKGGKLLSVNNNKPQCLTATQAAALAKALKLG
jgi:branched-chain amino acid transport system substrate-binding protein